MKYRYIAVFLFLSFLLIPLLSKAKQDAEKKTSRRDEVRKQDVNSENLGEDDLMKILEKARHCAKNENLPEKADSVLKLAIALAEMTYDNRLILMAYNAFSECMDQGSYLNDRVELLPKMERVSTLVRDDSLIWKTYVNLADIYRSVSKYDEALECSYKSLTYAESMGKADMKAQSFISIARCLDEKNQLIEAFRNYLQAVNIAEFSGDTRLQRDAYKMISRFYHLRKNYNKAIEYKLKEMEIVKSEIPLDSNALMWNQYELEEISVNSIKTLNEANIWKILRYSARPDGQRLRYFAFSLYRAWLINTDQSHKLKDLYIDQYPEEFEELARVNPAMHFRVKALIMENEGLADSALFYFAKAEMIVRDDPNKHQQANFYIRYGQFLIRQQRSDDAIRMFEKALQMSTEAQNLEYSLMASKELESVYSSRNDFRLAYQYSHLNLTLNDSLNQSLKRDDLLLLEIDNAAKQREEALERERVETERRYNLQYTGITIIVILIFLTLAMLSNFRIPQWPIHLLGFVSFIMLFEFIVLISDQKIHHYTHGEPWKVLAIKIVLIGILMPLHHWTERRVIHYLIHKRVFHFSKAAFIRFLRELFVSEEPHK